MSLFKKSVTDDVWVSLVLEDASTIFRFISELQSAMLTMLRQQAATDADGLFATDTRTQLLACKRRVESQPGPTSRPAQEAFRALKKSSAAAAAAGREESWYAEALAGGAAERSKGDGLKGSPARFRLARNEGAVALELTSASKSFREFLEFIDPARGSST
jgi:hypothetical protein